MKRYGIETSCGVYVCVIPWFLEVRNEDFFSDADDDDDEDNNNGGGDILSGFVWHQWYYPATLVGRVVSCMQDFIDIR